MENELTNCSVIYASRKNRFFKLNPKFYQILINKLKDVFSGYINRLRNEKINKKVNK